jgi:hypothetical protein
MWVLAPCRNDLCLKQQATNKTKTVLLVGSEILLVRFHWFSCSTAANGQNWLERFEFKEGQNDQQKEIKI